MFGPLGRASGGAPDRPSTYDWLDKCLRELARFDVIRDPQPDDQFFAWTAIHGLADLQGSPAKGAQEIAASVEKQCDLIIAALRK